MRKIILFFFVPLCAFATDVDDALGRIDFTGARMVLFGESQHHVLENHELARSLFHFLVERRGFRTLAIEASWRLEDLFLRYEKTGALDATGSEMVFFSANFHSRNLVDIFRDARDWNVAHPHDRVRITGVQPESPVSDLRELAGSTDVQERCGVPATAKDDLAFSAYAAMRRAEKGSYFLGDDRARCRAAIDALAKKIPVTFRARAALLGLYLEFVDLQPALDDLSTKPEKSLATLREAYAAIDRRRLELLQLMVRRESMMLWMHGWHTARRSDLIDSQGAGVPPIGTVSIGAALHRLYGAQTVSIASVTYDEKMKYDDEGYVEPAMRQETGGRFAIWDAREHAAFFAAHPRAGADEGGHATSFDQAVQYDKIVFFPHLEKTKPPRRLTPLYGPPPSKVAPKLR